MAKGTRICKICGAEYEYCHTQRPAELFRWQDVACCIEHATEYFELVAAARGKKQETPEPSVQAEETVIAEEAVETVPAVETPEEPATKKFKKKLRNKPEIEE